MTDLIIETKSQEFIIHQRILTLAESRGIKLTNYKQLSDSEFNNQYNAVGMFEYEGKKGAESINIIFIGISSAYMKKDKLNKLINLTNYDKYIIIITANKKIGIDNGEKNVEFLNGRETMLRDYKAFFENRGIKIRIIKPDELKEMTDFLFISDIKRLPTIKSTCHECIYSGAEKGDVIEIISTTPTTSLITATLMYVD